MHAFLLNKFFWGFFVSTCQCQICHNLNSRENINNMAWPCFQLTFSVEYSYNFFSFTSAIFKRFFHKKLMALVLVLSAISNLRQVLSPISNLRQCQSNVVYFVCVMEMWKIYTGSHIDSFLTDIQIVKFLLSYC